MRYRSISRKQSQERGQTIALVALTIVTLLAMAALAIDVVRLYVAKGEVQRAADAAALVAAKAFVDSGVTSDPANTSLQTLAENMANAGITAILPQNKVAGAAPATLFCGRIAVIPAFAMFSAKVCRLVLAGSLVTPESTNALAATKAAASAARWTSPLATYNLTTSMANAAIASKVTIVRATSAIVWPRSCDCFREIFPNLIPPQSMFGTMASVEIWVTPP